MMFLVRGAAGAPPASLAVKAARRTPEIVGNGSGKKDYFCVGMPEDISVLRSQGWEVIELRDGWYEDDSGGGVAIFGHGKYWELRDTPFTVKESCEPASLPSEPVSQSGAGEQVNVRGAIFGV